MLGPTFSKVALRLLGWHYDQQAPSIESGVLLAAPHTSNWDFVIMSLFVDVYHLDIRWLGKHTLFAGFGGKILRKLGGLPVDRNNRNGLVQELSRKFEQEPGLLLVIPPEGTRSRREKWKSGFLHIAQEAGVPITATALDYRLKRTWFSAPISSSRSAKSIMDELRLFYRGVTPKYPQKI